MKKEYAVKFVVIMLVLLTINSIGTKIIQPKAVGTTAEINSGIIQLDDEAISKDVKKYCWNMNMQTIFDIAMFGIPIGYCIWGIYKEKKSDDNKKGLTIVIFVVFIILFSSFFTLNILALVNNPKSDDWNIRVDKIESMRIDYKTKGRSKYNVYFKESESKTVDIESYRELLDVEKEVYVVYDNETDYVFKIYPVETTNYLGKKLK